MQQSQYTAVVTEIEEEAEVLAKEVDADQLKFVSASSAMLGRQKE